MSLNNKQRISIIIEISDAMKQVHEADEFIHLDLKLEMHVKLIVLDSETLNRTKCHIIIYNFF